GLQRGGASLWRLRRSCDSRARGPSVGEQRRQARCVDRPEDAVAAYDEVVRRFGDAPESALRELVAQSLVNKGTALGGLLRSDEEIAAYDEVVAHFSDATEPALREQVVKALVNKMRALSDARRAEEASAVRESLVRRFGA